MMGNVIVTLITIAVIVGMVDVVARMLVAVILEKTVLII